MATIKDIAKAAGVSQGTVSNVLNGLSNVSSEKIRLVMETCEALGYIPNERAKLLRKGHTNSLGVLLPNLSSKCYSDFYLSFKAYAENHGYTVRQYLPKHFSPEAEEQAIQEARSDMVLGMTVISSWLHVRGFDPFTAGNSTRPIHFLFAERTPGFDADFIGFDYEKAGYDMAQKAIAKKYRSVGLLTGSLKLSHEAAFSRGINKALEGSSCSVVSIQTDENRMNQNILQAFDFAKCQALFVSNYDFAQAAKNILHTFYSQAIPDIYTVSPLFTMPEMEYHKYELNYRLLGHTAAKTLIQQIHSDAKPQKKWLDNDGFRNWFPDPVTLGKQVQPLNVLTLAGPTAYIIQSMSRLYTKQTGIPVNTTIYSYDEIYEAFNNLRENSLFDVLRLDVTWLSWFAHKILQPLDQIDPAVTGDLDAFLSATPKKYAYVNDTLYALPNSPSTQMLFYRRDLFTSPICRRMYQEKYKTALEVPTTFEDFNRTASFFSKASNPESPTEFGATLTLGSTGVAGSEYLARLFSVQDNLYDDAGNVHLDSPKAIHALEQLIELKRYSNPNYCSWWTNTASAFAQGDVAMAILYYNYASDLFSHDSKVADNVGYALVPGWNPVIGGGSLGVSKFSKQPKTALNFIRWVCSEPIASACTLLGGISPCKQSYDNYELINNYPWLKLAKSSIKAARGLRIPPDCTAPFDERRFLSIIGMAVKNAHSGAQAPADAMKYAQKLFEEQFSATLNL